MHIVCWSCVVRHFFCLQCVKSVLLNKIISSEKDMVGIVFFGTVSLVNSHKGLLVA